MSNLEKEKIDKHLASRILSYLLTQRQKLLGKEQNQCKEKNKYDIWSNITFSEMETGQLKYTVSFLF
jgi:uncharacterized Fe-S cluster-containing MiaB family protein